MADIRVRTFVPRVEEGFDQIDFDASIARLNRMIDDAVKAAGVEAEAVITVNLIVDPVAGAGSTDLIQLDANHIAQEVWMNRDWIVEHPSASANDTTAL